MSHAHNNILAPTCSVCSPWLMSRRKEGNQMRIAMQFYAQALRQEALLS